MDRLQARHQLSGAMRLGKMVRPERLELPTLCSEGRCSIQLSYGRMPEDILRQSGSGVWCREIKSAELRSANGRERPFPHEPFCFHASAGVGESRFYP